MNKIRRNSLRKFASFFTSQFIERQNSDISSYLEVRLEGGKYVLNGESVNYSFGGLHHVFKNVFERYNFSNRRLNKVLILGFGTGSVASVLRKDKNVLCPIVGVEKDKGVINLMNKYFKPESYSPLDLVNEDAYSYVKKSNEKFDLIVVDILVKENVPVKFMNPDFIEALNNLLSDNGIIFYNKMAHTERQKTEARRLFHLCRRVLGQTKINKIRVYNTWKWVLVHDRYLASNTSNKMKV